MTEPTTLAYLAGVIDSDGYITASSSSRKGRIYCGPRIGISGTRRQPHDLAARIFGGSVRPYEPRGDRSHHRTQFQWILEGDRAAAAIQAIAPYLLIKSEQAHLALQLQEARVWERMMRNDEDPYPWMPPGYDPRPAMAGLAEDIRSLNVRGRELDGRTWDEYPAGAA